MKEVNDKKLMTQKEKSLSFKMNVKFEESITAYALQIGGWLPLTFISTPMLLVDRNIIAMIKKIISGSGRKDVEANRWWFEFINSSSITLNPVLCALEGNNRCTPTYNEFKKEFDDVSFVLKQGLPSAQVVKFKEKHYQASYNIIQELNRRYNVELEFLVKVAPLVVEQYKDNRLLEIEQQILNLASSSGVTKTSLVLLAVLSCLYESKRGEKPLIARKVIKPKRNYTKFMAHNALSDIHVLELLIYANTIEGTSIGYCTQDKYLTAFWSAIQASNKTKAENTVVVDIKLGKELFTRISESERFELANRLSNFRVKIDNHSNITGGSL